MRHRADRSAAEVLDVALCLLLLVFAGPRTASGQSRVDRAALVVRVLDSVRVGVIGAEVALVRGRDERHTARPDSAGTTTFAEVEAGLWSLTVRRLGLRPISTIIRLAPEGNVFTVVATPSALTLSGVRVVGDVPYSARLDAFERRRLSGAASATVTRAQIDRLDPQKLSRMLRGVNGLRIGDSSGYTVAISTRGAKPTRNTTGFAMVPCVMRVVVDGTLMPALFNIDEIVPRDVHGIEVYYGPSRIPPELAGLRTDNWCGVIAIWTRDR